MEDSTESGYFYQYAVAEWIQLLTNEDPQIIQVTKAFFDANVSSPDWTRRRAALFALLSTHFSEASKFINRVRNLPVLRK